MKHFRLFFPLLFIIMIGCGSKVPIADLDEAVSYDRIIGDWTTVEQDSNEYIEFSVRKFNDREYAAWVIEGKEDSTGVNTEIYFYRLYLINIDNTIFINAQDINSSNPLDRLYHFLKYESSSDSTASISSLQNIGDIKIDDFQKSEDLYDFIKVNIPNEKLYGDTIQLTKIQKMRSF